MSVRELDDDGGRDPPASSLKRGSTSRKVRMDARKPQFPFLAHRLEKTLEAALTAVAWAHQVHYRFGVGSLSARGVRGRTRVRERQRGLLRNPGSVAPSAAHASRLLLIIAALPQSDSMMLVLTMPSRRRAARRAPRSSAAGA
mmetsp:Transcript_17257/g.69426  ORF Transcript_17257/g.69426 Transcript_17257/m.69426 type:complete len:143 (-) Transcript_17257:337-765(-)